jgi:hypothetical protein
MLHIGLGIDALAGVEELATHWVHSHDFRNQPAASASRAPNIS